MIIACIYLAFTACKKSTELTEIAKNQNIANKKAVIAKLRAGSSIKIACEGTSLTYGEDIQGLDTVAPSLPAGPTRAKYQYPASMLKGLNNPNISLSLRGYPGDRTTEAIERWKDSTTADICIIEYGTNDAYNFVGYASGIVTVKVFKTQLKTLIERRIHQGAWVIICLPPSLENKSKIINAYRSTVVLVALEYSLNVFDVNESIRSIPAPYSDNVHLNSEGYQKWGIDLSKLVSTVNN